MKKFICALISLMIVFAMCSFTACSDNSIPENSNTSEVSEFNSSISNEVHDSEVNTTEPTENTESRSDISVVEEKSESMSINNSSSSNISVETSTQTSEDTSKASSEVVEESSESSKLVDVTQKYPKPEVDENSIVVKNGIYYMSGEINFKDYADYIMETFNGKVYNPGDIIDVKASITSQENKEIYYDIFENIYRTWNFATIEKPFEEIEANFDDYQMKYVINDNQNLVLKYSQNYSCKLYIYFKEEYFYILVTKI